MSHPTSLLIHIASSFIPQPLIPFRKTPNLRFLFQECNSHHPSVRPELGQEGARVEGGEEEGGQAALHDAPTHCGLVAAAEEEG